MNYFDKKILIRKVILITLFIFGLTIFTYIII